MEERFINSRTSETALRLYLFVDQLQILTEMEANNSGSVDLFKNKIYTLMHEIAQLLPTKPVVFDAQMNINGKPFGITKINNTYLSNAQIHTRELPENKIGMLYGENFEQELVVNADDYWNISKVISYSIIAYSDKPLN